MFSFIILQVPFCEGDAESSIIDTATKSVQLDCSGVGIVYLLWGGTYELNIVHFIGKLILSNWKPSLKVCFKSWNGSLNAFSKEICCIILHKECFCWCFVCYILISSGTKITLYSDKFLQVHMVFRLLATWLCTGCALLCHCSFLSWRCLWWGWSLVKTLGQPFRMGKWFLFVLFYICF